MESIKSLFRRKHKYHNELIVPEKNSFRQTSFRVQPFVPKNPYSVVTEPKTKKGPRSCPGGGFNYSSRSSNITYENVASNGFQRPKLYGTGKQISRHSPMDDVDDRRFFIQSSFQSNAQRSSEYGSADPSPTNPHSNNNNHSFDSSDSEAESTLEEYYRNLYEKNLRRIERKYRRADRAARSIEEKYYKLGYAFESLKNQNLELKHMLNAFKIENESLKAHVNELKTSQQTVLNAPVVYAGAPEAMCSISELARNSVYPSQQASKGYHGHDNNENEEIKIFDNREEFELPRHASNSIIGPCQLSPEPRITNSVILDENAYITMNAELSNNKLEHQANQMVHFERNDYSNQSSKEEDSEESVDFITLVPDHHEKHLNVPSFTGQIKRSFSDSDLRELKIAIDENAQDEHLTKHTNRNRLKRASTRYTNANYSSSYSSDDEHIQAAINLQIRQLKPRGSLVHYRPPRRSILNKGTNVFRRCGPSERKAIAEFDYLHEISTNSSGLE